MPSLYIADGHHRSAAAALVGAEKQNHFYQEIRKNADRLLALINDILRLSDLDRKDSELHFTEVDLYETVSECMEVLSVNAKQRNVTIELEGKTSIVCGNKDMLKELVENLGQNAIRYNNPNDGYCDLIYLASNFNEVFNPWPVFDPADADTGAANYTGIRDEALAEAAANLSHTEPGDNYGYVVNWITMQERFAEALPMIPVYSNVYYDFYTSQLQGFVVQQNMTWTEAIIAAVMTEPQEAEAASDEEFEFE